MVKAQGLSLPPQLQLGPGAPPIPAADGGSGSSSIEGGGTSSEGSGNGASGSGGGGRSSLPLSMLLGGSLVDRMDLLGRTGACQPTAFILAINVEPTAVGMWQGAAALRLRLCSAAWQRVVPDSFWLPCTPAAAALHVAAATGRADVVRQLAAAGASVNKALPMDFRALLKQVQQVQEQEAQAEAGAPAGHAQQGGGKAAADAAGDGAAAAGSGSLEGQEWGSWAESLAEPEGRAPPPKRGRYVTAGPAPPGPPSLQYCTALHCAALAGHVGVVHTLLATGQVRGLGVGIGWLGSFGDGWLWKGQQRG